MTDGEAREMARDLVRGSIIEDAAAQFIAQILKHAVEDRIKPLQARLTAAEAVAEKLRGERDAQRRDLEKTIRNQRAELRRLQALERVHWQSVERWRGTREGLEGKIAALTARVERLTGAGKAIASWCVKNIQPNLEMDTLLHALDAALAPTDAAQARPAWLSNCVVCGRIVDAREKDEGGDGHGCEYPEGWTCSSDCAEKLHPDPEWMQEGLAAQAREAALPHCVGEAALEHMLDRKGIKHLLSQIKEEDPEVWREICEETGRAAIRAIGEART